MYLIQIDEETGLIQDVPSNSGWKAIKVFRDLLTKKGIKAMTVVALSCDYLSVYSHYSEQDRPIRAAEEVYGKRGALDFENEFVVAAMSMYRDLQFNTDLEQERINNEIKMRLLRKITDANKNEDDTEISSLTAKLHKHEESIEKFNKRFDKKQAIKNAITNSGYELSRIENDIKSRKNSKFVNHGSDLENPNKLGLESKF
jgi:hypothetical protein